MNLSAILVGQGGVLASSLLGVGGSFSIIMMVVPFCLSYDLLELEWT